MSVITKQIELTPRDVIEALRSFEEEVNGDLTSGPTSSTMDLLLATTEMREMGESHEC
jgi:hypothetical protein